MVLINKAINEVTVKLVYYGPGLCGKTTNLEKIYENPKMSNKGKMISMSTETDRTLFFDFMPMELGTIGGQKVRVQLYTVPGQVFYDATRKLVLRGADGVVFVADSQESMRESNLESLENLKTNLRLNRLDPEKIALVFQYNKRDLPNISSVEEMSSYLKPGTAPVVEASAIQGQGVTATMREAIARILDNLKRNVDITLYDAAPLRPPDMRAGAGATSGSAGQPKVGITRETPLPAPPPPPASPPFAESSPFLASPQEAPAFGAVAFEPVEEESMAFELVDESSARMSLGDEGDVPHLDAAISFEPGPPQPIAFESPSSPSPGFGVVSEVSPFDDMHEPEGHGDAPGESLFAAPFEAHADEPPSRAQELAQPSAVPSPNSDLAALRLALDGARRVVRHLEMALEAAKEHERHLRDRLGE